ncbi:hypothetical protein HanRHA438_Chr15g0704071 [Helianthus annuus]|nr:hypothetical protein HanRHA438_Chr15g0704071 [Helianthus annuus]
MDQVFPKLLLQVFLEFGRIRVPEFGSDLENYYFGFCFRNKPFDVMDHDVNIIRDKYPMTDFPIFVDPNIEKSSPKYELFVNGQRLALAEWASNNLQSDLVGPGIMGSGPDNLVQVDLVRVEARNPVFAVGRVVIGARKAAAGALF